jgi:hypothetical protein
MTAWVYFSFYKFLWVRDVELLIDCLFQLGLVGSMQGRVVFICCTDVRAWLNAYKWSRRAWVRLVEESIRMERLHSNI